MNLLNCLIVEIEKNKSNQLVRYLRRFDSFKSISCCSTLPEAAKVIQTEQIDLVILEIPPEDTNGMNFLESIIQDVSVIILSSTSTYALKGIELGITDYLLKPIDFERFSRAIEKVTSGRIKSLSGEVMEKAFILVNSEHKVYRIYLNDILYIQSMREYVAYYTSFGRVLSLGALKQLEEELPADRFLRVHKSFIVARNKVSVLEKKGVNIKDVKIPIGASYRQKVINEVF